MKKQLKKMILVCLIVIACMQLCGCNFHFWNFEGSALSELVDLKKQQESNEEDTDVRKEIYVVPEKDTELIVEHDNGDTVYCPEESNLSLNEDSAEIYYDNLVIAYTFSDLSKDEADDLAAKIGGAVIGDISGAVNRLQILVEPADLETLNHYADILMESEDVLYASYETPMFISENNTDNGDTDQNPWSADGVMISDKNEEIPDGNDWWAEAIGAYSAWDYVDRHPEVISEITVGILDSGFDPGHEDLGSKITMINDNSPTDHGTLVSGIIAAENNTVGLRGIADSADLICADWSQVNIGEDGEQVETEVFSSGEWSELTKQMIESGAKVINNSWGYALSSSGEYYLTTMNDNKLQAWLLFMMDDIFGIDASYDAYRKSVNAYSRRTAMESILLIIELQLSEQDFLIVQAAGNGFDDRGDGYDASNGDYYVAINEELFETLSESTKNLLEDRGITYDTIRSHIMIVGAVENSLDNEGNYYLCSFSNYGNHVDICAPGIYIFSTVTTLDDNTANRDKENDGLVYVDNASGTSMAAPMVSGAAALIWSLDPSLSSAEVKNTLTDEANTRTAIGVTGNDEGTIYRMLNVGKAVNAVTEMRIKPENPVGMWEIDSEQTMDKNGVSMWEIFGTSSKYGSELCLKEDGYFSYYMAAGFGGAGTWLFDNGKIIYTITTYDKTGEETGVIEILEDNLVMDCEGYQIYWKRIVED